MDPMPPELPSPSVHWVHDWDPIAFSVGGQDVSWYWLAYLAGFAFVLGMLRWLRRQPGWRDSADAADAFLPVAWLGLLLGARLGYAVFYNLRLYWDDPVEILRLWHGGMSFHGALLGVALAAWIRGGRSFARVVNLTDPMVIFVPLCLALGRWANFVNGELAGRVSHVPWAIVFPHPDNEPRHPSQLYEAVLEGFLLQILMLGLAKRPRRPGEATGRFLLGYGILRFIAEFWREPDAQIGFLPGGVTLGQGLCAFMAAAGLLMLAWARAGARRRAPAVAPVDA